ncbi:MAG: adventurous gliding motility lipoprotein CglC [Deltaproteobacteria bacterium]|nr:adventurous gliding motility lipoprotein CglC [Deltaproteobacteria bacterium]
MTSSPRASLTILLATLAVTSCQAKTDLGQTCKMTKPCDTPPCPIPEDKVARTDIDYVALGSAECDDLVCIRTAGSENPPNDNKEARGYCTAACLDDLSCQPDFQGLTGQLKCEKLLLENAEAIFGSGAASKYCVKPRASK